MPTTATKDKLSETKPLALGSLQVQRYRAFRDLQIAKLGRVNLVVGKNSVGKSSLLEAIWLYGNAGHPRVVNQLLSYRDAAYSTEAAHVARELFFGRPNLPVENVEGINIGQAVPSGISIGLSADYYSPNNGLQLPQSLVVSGTLAELRFSVSDSRLHGSRSFPVENAGTGHYEPIVPTAMTTNGPVSNTVIANAWNDILRSSRERLVIEAAALIVPGIRDLHFITRASSDPNIKFEPVPIISLDDIKGRVPLRSLGDGVLRGVNLAVFITAVENGIALIDEIDTGLHYTVMADIWRLIFRVARDLNVQVFATTHSWDCIEAFNEAAQETEGDDEAMLIRLGRFKGDVVSTLYDKADLAVVTRGNIEVR